MRALIGLLSVCLLFWALPSSAQLSEQPSVPSSVPLKVGAEQGERYLPLLKDQRVALVVNQTSRVGERHLVDYLLTQDVNVVKVLAPEHGFRGDVGAGETIHDATDAQTGLPIVSIYGASKKPSAEMLADVDVLLFDIQDVGARFYTYISTMHYVMAAAAENDKAMLVLDRPNPNGAYVDGPVLDLAFQSFVGMHEIPLLHGMTVAELAQMIKGEGWIEAAEQLDLTVIPVANYRRDMTYVLPVAPSPNLPNQQAIQLYPSLCLFEATAVSIGRGTAFPFQVMGHDKVPLGEFRFTPRSMAQSAPTPKLENREAFGVDLRESNVQGLDLRLFIEAYHAFAAAGEIFFTAPEFMDKLSGTAGLREAIEAGASAEEIRASWQADLARFKERRQPYLLYP